MSPKRRILMRRRPKHWHRLALVGTLVALSWHGGAMAQTDLLGGPAATAIPGTTEEAAQAPSYQGDIFTRGNLFGDIAGLRTFLGHYGVTLGLQETTELY